MITVRIFQLLFAWALTRFDTSYGFSLTSKHICSKTTLFSTSTTSSVNGSWDTLKDKHFLVVGGSGRVGGSVVTQLLSHGARVTVGGTRRESLETSRARWIRDFPELPISSVSWVQLNREDASTVAPQVYDLVIHTAGPFQGKVKSTNGILDACITHKTPYVDVCDDYCTAMAAKSTYGSRAKDQGVPCVISTGCWPGVSSLMAKQLVSALLRRHSSLSPKDLKVDFSFFTAGSGGAGSTLLVATFLILAEEALVILNGRRKPVKAMKHYTTVNFGPIIGDKLVAHLNLLETASVHDILGVGSSKALFGTAPDFWNVLLGLMAQLPSSILANEDLMTKLALFSLPIVRVVDYFAGATNAMRCDVSSEQNPNLRVSAIYGHQNLEPCVGECVVSFCVAILDGMVPSGVWFPEEAIEDGTSAASVLRMASVGAHTVQVDGSIDIPCDEIWGRESR
jgi:Saccharopine dehydrogenase NADP binding domain